MKLLSGRLSSPSRSSWHSELNFGLIIDRPVLLAIKFIEIDDFVLFLDLGASKRLDFQRNLKGFTS